jgi:hypothetical protein
MSTPRHLPRPRTGENPLVHLVPTVDERSDVHRFYDAWAAGNADTWRRRPAEQCDHRVRWESNHNGIVCTGCGESPRPASAGQYVGRRRAHQSVWSKLSEAIHTKAVYAGVACATVALAFTLWWWVLKAWLS